MSLTNNYQDSSVVVPTFTGINASPRVPTSTRAGNGSDVIARFNTLLGYLDQDLTDLDSNLGTIQTSVNTIETSVNTLQTNVGNLDSRVTALESGGSGSITTSANVDITETTYDTYVWVVYLPYFFPFDNGHDLFTGSDLALYTTANTEPIRRIDLAYPTGIDLTQYIEYNGAGIYLFVAGQLAGAYDDDANISTKNGENNIIITENTALKNAAIKKMVNSDKLGYGFYDYRFTDVDGTYFFNTGYNHILELDVLEVFSNNFEIDIQITIQAQ